MFFLVRNHTHGVLRSTSGGDSVAESGVSCGDGLSSAGEERRRRLGTAGDSAAESGFAAGVEMWCLGGGGGVQVEASACGGECGLLDDGEAGSARVVMADAPILCSPPEEPEVVVGRCFIHTRSVIKYSETFKTLRP